MTEKLAALEQRNPEWRTWLSAIGQVLAADGHAWDHAVPRQLGQRHAGAPLLAGAVLDLDAAAPACLLERLTGAVGCGSPVVDRRDASDVFREALNREAGRLRARARSAGLDPEAFHAVAALLPLPFLRTCNERLSAALQDPWRQGYCPLCGAWTALAEICGVERARYLRCGECGSAWRSQALSCPYCGLTDHKDLSSLVVEGASAQATLEICARCQGYLKTFSRLSPSAPEEVMLQDLASVELDLAAIERGYQRPEGPGYALGIQVKGDA